MTVGQHFQALGHCSGYGEAFNGKQRGPAGLAVIGKVTIQIKGGNGRQSVETVAEVVSNRCKFRGNRTLVALGKILHLLASGIASRLSRSAADKIERRAFSLLSQTRVFKKPCHVTYVAHRIKVLLLSSTALEITLLIRYHATEF